MTTPVIRPAQPGESQLANRWAFQVDTATSGAAVWTTVFGVSQFAYNLAYQSQDNSDFDSDGWSSTKKTQRGWSVSGTVQRKLYIGAEDTGQRFIRRAALAGRDVHVRWFDRYYGDEAFEGYASPAWEPQGGGVTDLDTVNFTLEGQGKIVEIPNPIVVAPTILSATPSAAPVGTVVTITGSGFFEIVTIKFGAVAAPIYEVNDYGTELKVTMPAGTAGPANITVQNSVGTSIAFTYTRGA